MDNLISMVYRLKNKYEQQIAEHDFRVTINLERKEIGMEIRTGTDLRGDEKWEQVKNNNEAYACLLEIIATSMIPGWPRHWDGDLQGVIPDASQLELDRMIREHLAGATIEAGKTEPVDMVDLAARVCGLPPLENIGMENKS